MQRRIYQRWPRLLAFLYGLRQFRSQFGVTYPGDADPECNSAYDFGRELAHRLTFRRFEP